MRRATIVVYAESGTEVPRYRVRVALTNPYFANIRSSGFWRQPDHRQAPGGCGEIESRALRGQRSFRQASLLRVHRFACQRIERNGIIRRIDPVQPDGKGLFLFLFIE